MPVDIGFQRPSILKIRQASRFQLRKESQHPSYFTSFATALLLCLYTALLERYSVHLLLYSYAALFLRFSFVALCPWPLATSTLNLGCRSSGNA